jgi:hypothetical protein
MRPVLDGVGAWWVATGNHAGGKEDTMKSALALVLVTTAIPVSEAAKSPGGRLLEVDRRDF